MIGEPMRHEKTVNGALFNSDGTKILTWSEDGKARLWNADSGAMIGEPMRHEKAVNGALFNSDGTKILTWSEDGTARLWNADSGAMIGEPMRHNKKIIGTIFNKDGSRILTWNNENKNDDNDNNTENFAVRLWNTADNSMIGKSVNSTLAPIFSIDSNKILTLSGNTIRCWNADNWNMTGKPMQHEKTINGALFNKDGTKVLSWSKDNSARMWSADSGAMLGEPMRHEGNIYGAIFNKNETRILTWSEGGTAHLWNTDSGTMIGEPMRHEKDGVNGALFNKEESRILTTGSKGTLWSIEADYDFPKEYLPLFVEVATETTLDDSGNVRSLKSSELKERRKEYIRINEDHLKTCKYKHVNFYLQHQKPAWNIP